MLRRLIALLAVLAVASIGVVPSQAAAKKKPDLKGSYPVTAYPDPAEEAVGEVKDGCTTPIPASVNHHKFTVPGAGKLIVHLVSPDPTGAPKGVGMDWDLWLVAPNGEFIDSSHGGTADEQTTTVFKKKTTFTIDTCNLMGQPNATVTWVFKWA